jgi:hypothetical protein
MTFVEPLVARNKSQSGVAKLESFNKRLFDQEKLISFLSHPKIKLCWMLHSIELLSNERVCTGRLCVEL